MKTQLELAQNGVVTSQMQQVAVQEDREAELIRTLVARGEIVIPVHPNRPDQNVVGIGTGLRTKVNASIGTSSDIKDIDLETEKAKVAEEEKADMTKYIKEHNKQFNRRPGQAGSAFLPVPASANLDKIFCRKYERTVNKDNTISFNHRIMQIGQSPLRVSFAKCKVTVYEHLVRYPT